MYHLQIRIQKQKHVFNFDFNCIFTSNIYFFSLVQTDLSNLAEINKIFHKCQAFLLWWCLAL